MQRRAPGWHSSLSIWLLVWAQAVISGSSDQIPHLTHSLLCRHLGSDIPSLSCFLLATWTNPSTLWEENTRVGIPGGRDLLRGGGGRGASWRLATTYGSEIKFLMPFWNSVEIKHVRSSLTFPQKMSQNAQFTVVWSLLTCICHGAWVWEAGKKSLEDSIFIFI